MIWAYLIHLGVDFWREKDGDGGKLGFWTDEMITEDETWRDVTSFIAEQGMNTLLIDLGEGIEYESHPELACKNAWSKEKLKTELDRLRKMGLNPIPKLNFATTHDAWLKEYSRMIATPTYYKVVRDLIDEVSELFDKPDLLHVGMDEEFPHCIGYQRAYGMTHMRQGELYWHDLDFYLDCCNKNGVRGWTWCDMGWFMQDGVKNRLSREYVVSNAMYERLLNFNTFFQHPGYDTYEFLSKLGFEQIPTCATYTESLNQVDAVELLGDMPGLKGFITAPWFRTREIDSLKLKAEAKCFGFAKQLYEKKFQ